MKLTKLASLLKYALVGQYEMKMAAFDSDEYALQVGSTATPLDPTQAQGRVRIGHFNFAALTAAANDTLNLLKMPAGKIRILRVCIQKSAFGAGGTLDMGFGAYTNRSDGAAVAADPDAFVANLAMDATTAVDQLVDVVVDSRGGWTLTGLLETAGATAETLKGWIEYTID